MLPFADVMLTSETNQAVRLLLFCKTARKSAGHGPVNKLTHTHTSGLAVPQWQVTIPLILGSLNHDKLLTFTDMREWLQLWQSHVEIKDYSIAYFEYIPVLEALYRWTAIKSGAHTHFIDGWIANESTKWVWAPPLMEIQRYSTLNAAMRSNYTTESSSISTQDYHNYVSTTGSSSSEPT